MSGIWIWLGWLSAAAAAAPATTLVDVQVYPIPWKPGSSDTAFDAGFVTFANLPPGTEVSIYTLRGQRLWSGVADSAGVARWTGVNQSGRPAATGTYIALLDGGGRKTTRRVILVR